MSPQDSAWGSDHGCERPSAKRVVLVPIPGAMPQATMNMAFGQKNIAVVNTVADVYGSGSLA